MFKKLLDWLFAREDEIETPVLVHDFSERVPGHDVSITYDPIAGYGDAVITSLEKIQVGELVDLGEGYALFSVDSVEEIAPMVYRAHLSVLEVE